jgi:hypothetical protein
LRLPLLPTPPSLLPMPPSQLLAPPSLLPSARPWRRSDALVLLPLLPPLMLELMPQ